MDWTNLPTDYTDAQWSGLKKYVQVDNGDGTVSFQDSTVYTNKEKSFFGAQEANQMNAAMNTLAEHINDAADSASAAADSASAAATSATKAATSETNAATSASTASSKASAAADSASEAATSASTASTKASAAATSATNAASSASSAKSYKEQTADLLTGYINAGAHNALFRGKALGTPTSAQYSAISAGTFDDLYIGDYWTINGVNYRIAAFDYYYNCGDTNCTTHHVVVVPDTCLYNAQMNTSNVTDGGYVGSAMYTSNLASAKTTINSAFSGHVLSHRIHLVNAVSSGRPSGGTWYDSTVDLMCEQMVYGGWVFGFGSSGTSVPNIYRVEKSQLPLFQHAPHLIGIRNTYWLRDVISAAYFACVADSGDANCNGAGGSSGVRPAFCVS